MSTRRRYEQGYASFWRSLKNFLLNSSGFNVSGVARVGSRGEGTHKDKSDLDVIFAIAGNPLKTKVYPPLVERLKKGFNVNADIGRSYNIIKIWKKQIKCDLALRSEAKFKAQVKSQKYRED